MRKNKKNGRVKTKIEENPIKAVHLVYSCVKQHKRAYSSIHYTSVLNDYNIEE